MQGNKASAFELVVGKGHQFEKQGKWMTASEAESKIRLLWLVSLFAMIYYISSGSASLSPFKYILGAKGSVGLKMGGIY